MQSRVTFDGKVQSLGPRTFVCVLKFDSPLTEDHRVNRRLKWGRRIVRRPRRAKSDCPTSGDRGAGITLVRHEGRALP